MMALKPTVIQIGFEMMRGYLNCGVVFVHPMILIYCTSLNEPDHRETAPIIHPTLSKK